MLLADKVALITGGAGGIGKQIALTFARECAKVIIVDVKQAESEETVSEIGGYSEGSYLLADISHVGNIRQAVADAHARYGRIDVLVNNAGISMRSPVEEVTEEEWDRINAINLKAAYFFSAEVAKIMKQQRSGRIVNMSSIRGLVGDKTHVGYSVTKAGMQSLTRSFAVSLAEHGIHVNSVSPGYVLTPMTRHNLDRPGWNDWVRATIPLGRLIEMQEVANAVLFLASDLASGITGHNLVIDGGWTAQD